MGKNQHRPYYRRRWEGGKKEEAIPGGGYGETCGGGGYTEGGGG